MKKILKTALVLLTSVALLASCGIPPNEIDVVSREDGSGTRGAFIELFGILEKGSDGSRTDRTTKTAIVVNSTDVMLNQVVGDENAIGYVSVSSLNDSVKAIAIDGAAPTTANINSGDYTIARNFYIATKPNLSPQAQDFYNYIISAEGQAIVAKSYIPYNAAAPAYVSTNPSGVVRVNGSSSVSPLMEKLAESYRVLNPNVTVEVQSTESTSGITSAMEGTCDIGMSSRDLSENEAAVLTPTAIAIDGIAVIVNPANPVNNMTKDEVNKVFTGEITTWGTVGN